jgi:hypothetical protein
MNSGVYSVLKMDSQKGEDKAYSFKRYVFRTGYQ